MTDVTLEPGTKASCSSDERWGPRMTASPKKGATCLRVLFAGVLLIISIS
jgi:hypothetical protein